ncbi:MAG: hypothetical protein NTV34_21510 [Proteobacteria bacterium]|nr:hypothetical protein [Pseudomonadota bacterium]
MKSLSFYVLISLFCSEIAAARVIAYQAVPHTLRSVPEACEVCATFYRVDRPLIESALDHSYVAARYVSTCGAVRTLVGDVQYGLSKGAVDTDYFTKNLSGSHEGMTFLGQSCGSALLDAHAAAAAVTRQWTGREANNLIFIFDILVAPVGGRPCGNAADDVQDALAAYL